MLINYFILLTYTNQCFSESRILTPPKHAVKLTVVNGWPIDVLEVPYLVSLKEPAIRRKNNKTIWINLCGASIISSTGNLLTAAHCFEENHFLFAKRPYILRAVTGSPYTDIESEGVSGISKSGIQWRQVRQAILHQDFVFPKNDIALVFVDYPWDFKKGVKPIALPRDSKLALNLWNCYTAGYGRTGHGANDKTSAILMTAHIETMPPDFCTRLWQKSMDSFICTGSIVGDVSEGDSGGPLWCDQGQGPELTGIVSGKSFDKSTIYTRVSYYLDWISNQGYGTTAFSKGSANLFSYRMFWFIILTYNMI